MGSSLVFFITNGYWNFPVTKAIYKGQLKVVCSPGLNCYSCPAATTYCPIGSLQQLLAGIRMSIETGQFFIGFYVIGTMGVIGEFVGRMVCGWACPFELVQELLHKIPSPKFNIWPFLRYVKYGLLIFMVKILILIFFIVWAVLASRPFCRISCPLGAFYALFSKAKLIKLSLDYSKCTHCEACHEVCPMGVRFNESPDDMDCISCLACSRACKLNAISLEIGGLPISGNPKEPKTKPI